MNTARMLATAVALAATVHCAGALAQLYEKLGGAVVYVGKPHKPIYDLAFDRLAQRVRTHRGADAAELERA